MAPQKPKMISAASESAQPSHDAWAAERQSQAEQGEEGGGAQDEGTVEIGLRHRLASWLAPVVGGVAVPQYTE